MEGYEYGIRRMCSKAKKMLALIIAWDVLIYNKLDYPITQV